MAYEGDQRLGDLFQSRREKGISGLPKLSVTMNDGLVDRESLDRKMETNLADEDHLLVRKGDIAYNMMRMWQGASGLAEKDGLVSPAYVVLEPKPKIDSLYAAYLFKSQRMIYLFWAYSYGLTLDRLRLYYRDLSRVPVTIPALGEQKKSAAILSTWDKAIRIADELVCNAKTQKRALMQKLLIPGDEAGLGVSQWRTIPLGELFSERTETGRVDLPLLSVTREEGVIPREHIGRKDTSNMDKSAYLRVCKGDIGYNTMRMWQGISALSKLEGLISPAYTVVVPNKKISGRYASYLFKLDRVVFDFYRNSQGLVSDTWSLKFQNFSKITVTIPSRDEQEQIANVLENIDGVIDRAVKQAQHLRLEQRALMQKILAGIRQPKSALAT